MNCHDAREALWPPEKPRLVDVNTSEAQRHVDVCEACASWLAQDRAILDCYAALRQERTPPRVRERVFDALAHERANPAPVAEHDGRDPVASLQRGALVGVAAVVLLLGVGLSYALWGPRTGNAELVTDSALVEDYIRRAVGEDRLDTDDPGAVTRFLMRELGIMIKPAAIAGLRLTAVEVCLLDGRRAAMIKYRYEDHDLAHYIIPRVGGAARSPALSVPRDNSRPGSPSVVSWSAGSFEEALVADLDPGLLMELASRMPVGL